MKRRKFTDEVKAKVAVEAIKGDLPAAGRQNRQKTGAGI